MLPSNASYHFKTFRLVVSTPSETPWITPDHPLKYCWRKQKRWSKPSSKSLQPPRSFFWLVVSTPLKNIKVSWDYENSQYPLVIKHGNAKSARNWCFNRTITDQWSIFQPAMFDYRRVYGKKMSSSVGIMTFPIYVYIYIYTIYIYI